MSFRRYCFGLITAFVLAGNAFAQAPNQGTPVYAGINGWAPVFGVRDDSQSTPATAGTGYAVGDQITLNAGCTTGAQHNPMIVVAGVATGAITAYNVVDHGACSIAPANNVTALSTSGAGTGAAFTLSWAPLAGGIPVSDNANVNAGNLFITGTPPKYFSGTESVGVGIRPMRFVGLPGSSFNVAMGHNVEGGAGCPDAPTYVSSSTMLGTDTMRNSCGHSQVTLYGASAMKSYAQTGTAANHFAFGSTGVGTGTLTNWNAPVGDVYNTALGDNSCAGNVTGTVQFSGVTCIGARTGGNLRDATNTLIVSGGGPNPATVAGSSLISGNNVIMMGTGQNVIDVPAASTSNYISINNVIIGTMQAQPTFVSGFNLGAGFNGIASGQSSFRFGWNGGTTGGASGGVFAFPTPAPHGWDCRGRDRTNPDLTVVDFAPTSTTQVTMTTYSRTTGLVAAYSSGDVFDVSCIGF